MNQLQKFTSLGWLDGLIDFSFKFVAKMSEPLLAAGLVISAADYLSKGAVMTNHPAFSMAWAWTQAIALEALSGVVFVYALQAFRTQDKVKGAIYLTLALLLAIVGGGMLLLQVNAITLGTAESANLILNVMRVVVSISYIFLLRAKHIRFTDLADVREQPATPAPVVPDVDQIVEAIVSKAMARVTVELAQVQAQALPEHAQSRPANLDQIDEQPIYSERFQSKEAEIAAILAQRPGASVEEVAQAAGCNVRTAEKWIARLTEQKG